MTANAAGINPGDIFCTACRLLCPTAPPTAAAAPRIVSIPLESIAPHAKALKLTSLAKSEDVAATIHIMPQGGQLLTSATISDGKVVIPLSGSVAGIPYKLTITITLDLADKQITVELDIEEPLKFDHTWVFNLTGLIPIGGGSKGAAIAKGLELAAPTNKDASVAAKGIDFLCIIGCGGGELIPILIKCLPSLALGTHAYLACLAAEAPGAAANIVQCIATKCIN
jgi:hypothetical protein